MTALLAGGRKADIVATTLRAALQEASQNCPSDAPMVPTLVVAARALGTCARTGSGSDGRSEAVHPAAPRKGEKAAMVLTVTDQDTAASMGHPDAAVDVLGSPRIALWFELSTVPLMPPPGGGSRHVGTGLVVHHLGAARVGQRVTVEATVMDVTAMDATASSAVFACRAFIGDRVIATGVHQRIILAAPPT